MAESEAARDRVTSLDRLAEQAAGQLESMAREEGRDMLALLGVRVGATRGPASTGIKILHSHTRNHSPPARPG